MNKRTDWENALATANADLKKRGYSIDVNDNDEEGFFKCDILKDGVVVETYAENYYEDELEDLIADAVAYIYNL